MPDIPAEAIRALRDAMNEWSCGDLCDDSLREGLAAALPHLAPAIRAQVAEEIAKAIEDVRDVGANTSEWLAYDHAAGLARLLRVPDCGDQNHAADGGPCGGCGFDIADPTGATRPADPD